MTILEAQAFAAMAAANADPVARQTFEAEARRLYLKALRELTPPLASFKRGNRV